ncbi:sigma-70 family RNA polymerase sigma factor [Niabella insulamsoli]|uniref:sigma-70 family RNA polymerase sigma factor n=1 Tax=Niabella insulamsoli TaxID=3144874 RepID=UPI0031FBFA9C
MQIKGQKGSKDVGAIRFSTAAEFELMYRQYWFEAYSVAYRKLGSRQDAEDAIQTLFKKIWANRDTLQIKDMGAYLAVSANNIATDLLRKKQKDKLLKDAYMRIRAEKDAPTAEQSVHAKALQKEIENAVLLLPVKTQTVFRLTRYEHKSVKEVAAQLHLSEKAVEYHITKSLRHIKSFLKKMLQIFF